MFREMRRKAQQISLEECREILLRAKTGILGLYGDDGYPYTVPLNFVYTPPEEDTALSEKSAEAGDMARPEEGAEAGDTARPGTSAEEDSPVREGKNSAAQECIEGNTSLGTIGFHCAKTGHKIDSIRRNEKVSFTVVDRDEIMPRERTTKYCSVIAFGRAHILEDEEEKRRAAHALGAKYSAGYEDLYMEETEDTLRRGTLCCVEITIDHMTGKIGKELMKERNKRK